MMLPVQRKASPAETKIPLVPDGVKILGPIDFHPPRSVNLPTEGFYRFVSVVYSADPDGMTNFTGIDDFVETVSNHRKQIAAGAVNIEIGPEAGKPSVAGTPPVKGIHFLQHELFLYPTKRAQTDAEGDPDYLLGIAELVSKQRREGDAANILPLLPRDHLLVAKVPTIDRKKIIHTNNSFTQAVMSDGLNQYDTWSFDKPDHLWDHRQFVALKHNYGISIAQPFDDCTVEEDPRDNLVTLLGYDIEYKMIQNRRAQQL